MSRTDRRRRFPEEPRRWRRAWSTGTIVDDGRGGAILIWVIALVWYAATLPGTLAYFRASRGVSPPTAWVLLFPAAGLFLVWSAVFQTAKAIRFGRSELTLEPFPAHPGEPLNVAVRGRAALGDAGDVALTLQCARRTQRGSGRSRRTHEAIVWADDRRAPVLGDGVRTLLRATFDVPPAALPNDDRDRRDQVLWRLVAHGERPGIDYRATFELPMFARRAGDSTPRATPFPPGLVVPPPTGVPFYELAEQGIHVRPLAGCGIEVEFPAARRVVPTLLLTLVALACDAVAVVARWPAAMFGRPDPGLVGEAQLAFRTLFAIAFGSVGLLLTLVAGSMWLTNTLARADRDGLTVTRRTLGLPRTRTFAAREIASVTPRQTMTHGDRVFYSLRVTTTAGKRHDVGGGIEGRGVAERLATAAGDAMR